ncbi:cyclopropane-fatty-acyl-phospholipid synthase [Geoalkalibacter ferrihydriticus]|uniref:Cyclopropane-fatty-acyl-phospholipid synthase n=2 Tax=Geoalkalibacter ferrihydriticus TaxID=392333 RepID=A0A0C2ED81_9BACT|nr:DUF1365 family protein [Geoalkalibacter ferrihydriticus]KIH76553.1 cyclopropane-fatty-acyl-phospholipid synthase [Geoalkalibacter ferrihydriticus DSM 17813]SDM01097.1 cyclopropane-fatty-acyl-phospholipid synthase [Geoalkalibacter ferrihydriticus]
MKSLIYQGVVSHARMTPLSHSFQYPVYFYAFDLDELPELAKGNPLFGYNQLRPVAIHDQDYLHPGNATLRDKLGRVLREAGLSAAVDRVVLVTAARFFNYVFNPVSFFYCYGEGGKLLCVLAQVNNTFGEMHLYLLAEPQSATAAGARVFVADKQFHVSPFFPREGEYRFQVSEPQERLDNQIHYYQAQQLAFIARLQGEAQPLTTGNLLRTILKHPLTAVLTMPRILWQAARLYWQRRLPVFTKPVPDHAMTIRPVAPTLLDRLGMTLCFRFLSRLPQGELQLFLPDGSLQRFGRIGAKPSLQLAVREYRFFRRIMLSGDIGFGEAYTDGDWSCDDLPGLLTLLAANEAVLNDRSLVTAWVGRWLNYLRHLLRSNTIQGSARNIREHYDLSNDFFASFIDPSMTYSSGLFASETDTLAQAQQRKIQSIIDQAGLDSEDHVLEIGCGWGSFAIEAVRQSGCRVTGITLSKEQLQFARRRVQEAGLSDRIELQLRDYRHIEGRYSKIISIEMLEAVGHAGLKSFFAACDRALLPGGKAVIQVITIPDRKYTAYRHSSDWIRKHIFPGGHLPSVGALARAMAAASSLNIQSLQHYGLDYAKTLVHWRQTLLSERKQITQLDYDDRFLRTWDYYFAYCQAGFNARIIDLAQLVLHKPGQPLERP